MTYTDRKFDLMDRVIIRDDDLNYIPGVVIETMEHQTLSPGGPIISYTVQIAGTIDDRDRVVVNEDQLLKLPKASWDAERLLRNLTNDVERVERCLKGETEEEPSEPSDGSEDGQDA